MKGKEANYKGTAGRAASAEIGATRKQRSRISDRLSSILTATTEFHGTWNPSSESIHLDYQHFPALGYSRADWPRGHMPIPRVVHPDDLPIFEARLDAHLAGRIPLMECEVRLQTRAGSYRWFQILAKTIRTNRRGASTEIGYVARDIHEAREKQERLLTSHERLMAIIESSHDCIFVVDPENFRLTFFNKAFENQVFRAHNVRVRSGMCAEDVAAQQAEFWNTIYRRAMMQGSARQDYVVPGLNEIHQIYAQTLLRGGSTYGICVFGHDITNRKLVETALRSSEEKFANAFRQAPLALSLTSLRDHRFIDVNNQYAKATGYSREELLGKTPYDLGIWVHPEKRMEIVRRLESTGEVGNVEILYHTKAGEIREAVGSVIQIEVNGEPCMLATVTDTTDRNRALRALRESEECLRIAVQAGHMYTFDWNVVTDAVNRSEQSVRILDFTRSGSPHTKQELIDRILPDDRQTYIATLKAITAERPDYKAVFRLKMRDGSIAWLEESGRGIFGPDGSLMKVIGITSDVTEIRDTERALRELNGRLITSQEEERRRIARELHDHIGQEIALLCVQAQRLDSGAADEEHTSPAEVHEIYRRLKVLANDVSKLSHRLHSSELTLLGLAIAADRLCRDFAHQYELDVDCHIKGLPSHLDSAKSLCIYRVLEEALQNIVKHSHATQVIVNLLTHENRVILKVEDNGEGFDAQKASHGLGLLSIRERLNLVGGRFNIVSSRRCGTAVSAEVPI